MGSTGIACLGLVGVVVALSLPAWLLSRWFADRGVRPFREAAKHLPRSVVECLLLLCVTFGFIRYGGSKEGGDAGGGQSAPMMALPGVPTVLPVAVDSLGMNIPTNFPPVTNLCFWGVERGSNAVSLGIAWPASMAFTNDLVDLYGSWRLASNGWLRLLQIDVAGASSNAVVDVAFEDFPTNAMEGTAFFRLASQDDADGDGLPDAYEAWSLGTDPAATDTDGDGIEDAVEISAGTDPTCADTDGDGLTNGQECSWGTSPSWLDGNGDGKADGRDTDGDGVDDGVEIGQNSDPTDAGDGGSPNSRIPVPFTFGDPSGSHSEKYRLTVTPAEGCGSTPGSFSWLNEGYGECETRRPC